MHKYKLHMTVNLRVTGYAVAFISFKVLTTLSIGIKAH